MTSLSTISLTFDLRKTHPSQIYFLFLLELFAFMIVGCVSPPPDLESELEIVLPEQSDWVDYGMIFEAGYEGEWDHLLWGGFTTTAVKRDDTYYLFYQGARNYRVEPDETVEWRAIGVATSQGGINFTKYENNPVITWFPSGYPNGNGEEGAASGGVSLDENGDFVLFYGANTAISPTRVNADGRLAVSDDGFTFTDVGVVLNHDNRSIWGSGDELFPIAALKDEGQWIVYYLPNSIGFGRNLGVAWGNARDEFKNSAAVRSGLDTINAWGTAGKAKVGPKTYAIFTNLVTEPRTEARLMSVDAPDKLSDPVEVYRFDDFSQATVLLDKGSNTWFMYYRNSDASAYGVKLAPAGVPDSSPATEPTRLTAEIVAYSQVELTWDPAEDYDTGIAAYRIYRNDEFLAQVTSWQFQDKDVGPGETHKYSVTAVNYHGVEGPASQDVTIALP